MASIPSSSNLPPISSLPSKTMTYVPQGNCTAALLYIHYEPLYIVHWCQSLLALATFALCLMNLPRSHPSYFWQKKATNSTSTSINFHINVKILLFGALCFYALHSIVMFAMHFGYIVLFHMPIFSNICLYTISTWKCLLLRIPSYITVAGFTFAHLALCFERTIASWQIQSYEKFSAKLGIALLFPMFLLPIGWNAWIFHEENFLAEKSYCMSSSETSSSRMLLMSYTLIGLDLLAVLIDICLYAINKKQKMKKTIGYSLGKSFQLRENDLSIRLILPLSISHSFLFICFLLVYSALKTIFNESDQLIYATVVESAHLIETLYTFVSVGLFLVLRRRIAVQMHKTTIVELNRTKSERANLHAVQYQKNW